MLEKSRSPASVIIEWTFCDGNSGSHGSGSALTASGTTTVNITAVGGFATDGSRMHGEGLACASQGASQHEASDFEPRHDAHRAELQGLPHSRQCLQSA